MNTTALRNGHARAETARDGILSDVLSMILDRGPVARPAIAAEIGLSKSTVSSLVEELTDLGLVRARRFTRNSSHRHPELHETGRERTVGRQAELFEAVRERAVGLGLQIGTQSCSAQVVDILGGTRYKARRVGANPVLRVEVVVEQLAAMARDALAETEIQGLTVVGVAVALPGLVDATRGVIVDVPSLSWIQVPVLEMLSERVNAPHLPFEGDDEGAMSALGELFDSRGVATDDFVAVTGGNAIGLGIVADGHLVRGAAGLGGQFGHVVVDQKGRRCRCGNRGCLETLVGLDALLADVGLGDGTLPDLVAQARRSEPGTTAILDRAGRWLGLGLGAVVNLLRPQAIVLGGHLGVLAPWLIPAIERELTFRVIGASAIPPAVLASQLGGDAAVRGAAAVPLRRVRASPKHSLAGFGPPPTARRLSRR